MATFESRAANAIIQLLRDVAVAANEADRADRVFRHALRSVCRFVGWPVGHAFILDPADDRLRLVASHYADTDEDVSAIRDATSDGDFEAENGLPGQVMRRSEPVWITDLEAHPRFVRTDLRARFHVNAALAFPVLVGSRAVGVLEFFANTDGDPDPELLDAMSVVGTQLGRVVERQRSSHALRQSEERLRALTETAVEAIITLDERGQIQGWNPGAARIFRYSSEEVMGQRLTFLMPERYRMAHEMGLERVSRGGESNLIGSTVELEALRKDGSLFPIELSVSSWSVGGQRWYGGIVRDISARVQAQEAVNQKNRQLRRLAAHIERVREDERTRLARDVHDVIGQALTGLRMDVALIEHQVGNPDAVRESLERMKAGIDDSVGEVRRISSELRPGLLDDLGLQAALDWQSDRFQKRTRIQCVFYDETDDMPLGAAQATAVFRIYQELLTNVARHSGATEVASRLRREDEMLVLTVCDNGRGIRPEDISGTGSLGLLGMRERAAQWNGTVRFEGTESGTTVTIRLPIAADSETAAVKDAVVAAADTE